jgi:hypothetical protein
LHHVSATCSAGGKGGTRRTFCRSSRVAHAGG